MHVYSSVHSSTVFRRIWRIDLQDELNVLGLSCWKIISANNIPCAGTEAFRNQVATAYGFSTEIIFAEVVVCC